METGSRRLSPLTPSGIRGRALPKITPTPARPDSGGRGYTLRVTLMAAVHQHLTPGRRPVTDVDHPGGEGGEGGEGRGPGME